MNLNQRFPLKPSKSGYELSAFRQVARALGGAVRAMHAVEFELDKYASAEECKAASDAHYIRREKISNLFAEYQSFVYDLEDQENKTGGRPLNQRGIGDTPGGAK